MTGFTASLLRVFGIKTLSVLHALLGESVRNTEAYSQRWQGSLAVDPVLQRCPGALGANLRCTKSKKRHRN